MTYKKDTNYVTFIVYEGTLVYFSCELLITNVSDTSQNFLSQMPNNIFFSKSSKSILELIFTDKQIKVIARYTAPEKTKMVQEFTRNTSLFNIQTLKIPTLSNIICSFYMTLAEFKDIIDFTADSHIVVELAENLTFEVIGKARKIIKSCKKLEGETFYQSYSSTAFSKLKGLGILMHDKDRIFNEIHFQISHEDGVYFMILQSPIYQNIFLVVNPANASH